MDKPVSEMTAKELERANICYSCRGPLQAPDGHHHTTRFPTRDVCCRCAGCEHATPILRIGITGTRQGLTAKQVKRLGQFYQKFGPGEVHHGDCVGADEEADRLAQASRIPVVVHPPEDNRHRAYCQEYEQIREEKPYLARNRDIVNEADRLVVLPQGMEELERSGTWSTARYARKRKKPVCIIYPDGSVSMEGNWKGA